jgi:hypothetical protein
MQISSLYGLFSNISQSFIQHWSFLNIFKDSFSKSKVRYWYKTPKYLLKYIKSQISIKIILI